MKKMLLALVGIYLVFTASCATESHVTKTDAGSISFNESGWGDNSISSFVFSEKAESDDVLEKNPDSSVAVISPNESSAAPESSTTVPDVTPDVPPYVPISFPNIDEALAFIEDPFGNSTYWYERQKALRHMIDVFESDGYLMVVSHDSAAPVDGLSLYPLAPYEDIGVVCWFVYQETWIQVAIYNVKSDMKYFSDMQPDTLYNYYGQRSCGSKFYDTTTINHPCENAGVGNRGKDAEILCVDFIINYNHYVSVRANIDARVDVDMLVAFINGLTFTEIELP